LTFLQEGITREGKVDINAIDKVGLGIELKRFKDDKGAIKYGELIKIPNESRLPAMAERDLRGTITSVVVALTLSFETMNLKRGMTPFQTVDLAEAIVDSAGEDQLAIEDVLLFIQKLTRGEYGELYESMDAVKFMHLFNRYRDERWEAGIKIRDEKHEEFKRMGDGNEYARKHVRDASPFGQYMEHLRNKVQAKNDEIKENKKYQ